MLKVKHVVLTALLLGAITAAFAVRAKNRPGPGDPIPPIPGAYIFIQ